MLGSAQAAAPSAPTAAHVSTPAPPTAPSRAESMAAWFVVAAWCLLAVGASSHEGEYTPFALACVVAAVLVIGGVVVSGARLAAPSRRMVAVAAGVSLAAALAHPVGRYMHAHNLPLVQALAAAAATVTCATLAVHRSRGLWWIGAATAAAAGIATIVAAPDPHIDVWYLLQQSSDGLARGDDMYRQHWAHSHGLQAIYPYLPLTTVLLAPFRWIVGDVRAGLLLASVVTSAQLRRFAPAAPVALALLVLVYPHWAFVVDQSWTEPLVLLLLTTALIALDRGRTGIAVVALAVALATKQHVALLLPLFALWPRCGWRRTLAACGLAFAFVSPWLVAGPRDFWHDAVHANLALGVLQRALTIPSFFAHHGETVGFWLPLAVLVAGYVVIAKRAPRTIAGLALSSALVLGLVDVTNKQSFFNHYTLPLGLLVVALTAASRETARAAL